MSSRILLSLLKPEALSQELHYVLTQAIQQSHGGAVVSPVWAARAVTMFRGNDQQVAVTVGFPHGASKPTVKAIEATSCLKEGAAEVFVSAHLVHLVSADYDAIRAELMEIVRAARATRRDVGIHVILETALLMSLPGGRGEKAIETACRAVRESGCDGVISTSGFHRAGGTKSDAVELLARYGEGLTISAMGGIPNATVAEALLAAGATRAVVDPS